MRSSQATVVEDAQPYFFFNGSKHSRGLRVSAKEKLADKFFEIHDVSFCVALLVCLSEALTFLKISSGFETGVAGGPLGFSLVLGLLEATLYQWSHQIDDYNHNSVQALSIIKARIYVVAQGS